MKSISSTCSEGTTTLVTTDTSMAVAGIILIFIGIALVYLGAKNILEPLIMLPMGFGANTW